MRPPGIPLTGVLQTGVFGILEMCHALMRKLVFRDHHIINRQVCEGASSRCCRSLPGCMYVCMYIYIYIYIYICVYIHLMNIISIIIVGHRRCFFALLPLAAQLRPGRYQVKRLLISMPICLNHMFSTNN